MTHDEILEALKSALQAQPVDDGTATVVELIEASGGQFKVERLRASIRTAIKAGVLECVPTRRPDVTQRVQQVPGYRLVRR